MLIGVSGKIGAGKDTLAKFIQEHDQTFQNRKFADKLKKCAALLTGWEDQWTQEGKQHYLDQWGMTVGEFQQKLGTEGMRYGIHKDGWVIALYADYTPDQNWIITDVRFENEAQSVLDRGGLLVRINRDVNKQDGRDHNHPSETSLDNYGKFHFTIDNNKHTLWQLEKTAGFVYAMAKYGQWNITKDRYTVW